MANKNESTSCRLGRVGGQAVLEGVMMKAGEHTVTTCRKEDGTLVVNDAKFVSVRKKCKILNIPILRGVINFVEMMILSVKTLGASADALGLDEEKDDKKKGVAGTTAIVMTLGVILGFALAIALFIYLPTIAANGINYLYSEFISDGKPINPSMIAVIEGVMKIVIFLTYLALVALMPDIKRTFMYHGAEHKSIACFEAGEELTAENAKRHRRFHPRCGTSFMFLMILLGIFAGMFVRNVLPNLPAIAYSGIKLAILPLVMGVGYELLMLMGKHDNVVTRIFSAPGIWVQRLTTKEPTEDMLEVAIVSIKCALRDEFPEFDEYFTSRPWEADGGETVTEGKKQESSVAKATDSENAEEDSQDSDIRNSTASEADGEPVGTPDNVGTSSSAEGVPECCGENAESGNSKQEKTSGEDSENSDNSDKANGTEPETGEADEAK